jgi:iron complex transport system ATP-binding protein
MEIMEITHLKGRQIDTLSEGERQKVFLSQCLAQDPKALLLDEPVSHLDIRHQIQTFDALEKLHNEGLTIITVLHDLNLASEFCTRVMLISKGALMSDGDPRSVLTFRNIEEAYDAVVIVRENPLSGKPFVVPVSRRYLKK